MAVLNDSTESLSTAPYMQTLERLKAVGGGGWSVNFFSKGRKTVHCAAFLMQIYFPFGNV